MALTPETAATALAKAVEDARDAWRQVLHADAVAMRDEAHDTMGTLGGPDGDWPGLADATIAAKRRLGQLGRVSAEDVLYATGATRESFQVDDTNPDQVRVSSTSAILPFLELGTADMPPRPVLAPIAAKHAADVARHVGDAVAAAIRTALGQ